MLKYFQSTKLILTRKFLKLFLYLHRKKTGLIPWRPCFSTYQKYLDILAVRRQMIIYAKSFSNPSVSISHYATGLSAVCDYEYFLIILTIFDKKTCLKFSYTLIGKTVLTPWWPGFFINLINMNNLGRELAKGHLWQIIFKSDQ